MSRRLATRAIGTYWRQSGVTTTDATRDAVRGGLATAAAAVWSRSFLVQVTDLPDPVDPTGLPQSKCVVAEVGGTRLARHLHRFVQCP